MVRQFRKAPLAKQIRRRRAKPEQRSGIAAGVWLHQLEQLSTDAPMRAALADADAAAILDEVSSLPSLFRRAPVDKHADVGMQDRSASQRLIALKAFLEMVDAERAVVEHDRAAPITGSPSRLLQVDRILNAQVTSPFNESRKAREILDECLEIARRPASDFDNG